MDDLEKLMTILNTSHKTNHRIFQIIHSAKYLSSINPFLQIIQALKLLVRYSQQIKFRPPTSSKDLCLFCVILLLRLFLILLCDLIKGQCYMYGFQPTYTTLSQKLSESANNNRPCHIGLLSL